MPDPTPNAHPGPNAGVPSESDAGSRSDAPPSQPLPVPPPRTTTAPENPVVTTDFNIGEEFGTAKRNLPPARIVLVSIVAVAIVVATFAFLRRPKPQGAGSIKFVAAAEIPNRDTVLAAITFTLHNQANTPLWIHTLKAQLTAGDGHNYEDEAASAVDIDRYYQLFPSLKESSEPPLSPETKLPAGTEKRGTIVVSFPVTKEAFDQRKSLTVTIQPYDQPLPIILR
jgi:hypothetical protein